MYRNRLLYFQKNKTKKPKQTLCHAKTQKKKTQKKKKKKKTPKKKKKNMNVALEQDLSQKFHLKLMNHDISNMG